MFKWRSDRNKITVVFKLQFHATQVSEFGGNGLALSLVPAENGKPTAKLEKCVLRENCCYWENPVYETVKFIQDLKTGKIQERIYYFIISAGSPKGSLVGEFSINIADYAVANKAYSISFPFKSNPNSHLHVYIQRIQENSSQRDFEENEVSKINQEEKTLRRHFSEEVINTSSVEDEPLRKTVSLLPGVNAVRRGSNGSDITLTSTDSSSGLDTPRHPGLRNHNDTKKDQTSNNSNYLDQDRSQWELAIVPANNGSSTEYFMSSPSYAFSSERYQIGLDDSVEKLKADLVALCRRAEVSELELQTLRKQIVKESKKGQDLLREVTSLKQERDALKDECEKLNARQKRSEEFTVKTKLQFEGDPWELINEIREELNHEKQLNSSLQLQLQKTQESNAELLLAVQDLEEMLEKNNRGIISDHHPNRSASGESAVEIEESIVRSQSDDDEEQKALEELVKQHSDAQESYLLEQKIMDLCSEIEMYRRDKDELEMQMEQLALDYEILKQENHEFSCKLEQTHIQDQLKMPYEYMSSHAARNEIEAQNKIDEQSEEISRCVNAIKELEDRNKSLEENLRKQAENFEADKEALTNAWMEQEKRAADAESALSQSNSVINELETVIVKLKNELKELETRNFDLEEELEKQAQGSIDDKEALVQVKMELEQRALQAEDSIASSYTTIFELETRIKMLEDELKKQSDESSHTKTTVKELEALVHDLEEELEKQAEGFEADLEAVINTKVEQEKRAIQAEEALRSTRWKHANTVMRIQDEFKTLSAQMQRSFEASEKVVGKAVTESAELRRQNRYLQGMFQKAREEVQSVKNDYETRLQHLNGQISMKSTQMEQIMVENEEDHDQQSVSAENFKLRAEIERLISENRSLAELVEQREKLKYEELHVLRYVKDEKELGVSTPESEVEVLRAQCDNLKHSLYEDELEKEKLRKQVFQLQADLKKKDEAISSIEKKSKESNGRVQVNEKSRPTFKNTKSESARGAKEIITLKEKIKLLEGQVKSKEAAMVTSTAAFVEKEKELHGQIEKLQARLEELDQNCTDIDLEKVKEEKVSVGMQVDCSPIEVTLAIDEEPEDVSITTEDLNSSLLDSDEKPLPSTQSNTSTPTSVNDEKFDILLKEMILLKERNKSMEIELKEMQDRYSGISLKFAEVEGERQRLVMKLRNIKSAKKS